MEERLFLNMSIGLIAGSFDPPTLGHLDLIERAASLCHRLIVGVADNPSKGPPLFSKEERIALLREITTHEIHPIEGLVMDFAKSIKANFLIRGLRSSSDFSHEFQMAFANKKVGSLETLFLMADGRFAHISSTLIREIAREGKSTKEFLPSIVEKNILIKFS